MNYFGTYHYVLKRCNDPLCPLIAPRPQLGSGLPAAGSHHGQFNQLIMAMLNAHYGHAQCLGLPAWPTTLRRRFFKQLRGLPNRVPVPPPRRLRWFSITNAVMPLVSPELIGSPAEIPI